MNLNIDPEWLLTMAEKEANGILSVGGLLTRIKDEGNKPNMKAIDEAPAEEITSEIGGSGQA